MQFQKLGRDLKVPGGGQTRVKAAEATPAVAAGGESAAVENATGAEESAPAPYDDDDLEDLR